MLLMPQKTATKEPKFRIQEGSPEWQQQIPKYKWHMILNHASPEVLKRMARNPYVREPTLEGVT